MPSANHSNPNAGKNIKMLTPNLYVTEKILKGVAAYVGIQITDKQIDKIKRSESKYSGLMYGGFHLYLQDFQL
jgi:hypothetical protein